jgi:hypothetical protein
MEDGEDESKTEIEREGDQRGRQEYCLFFFAKVNQRRMKKTIAYLEDGNDILTEEADMMKHAIDFYRTLFGEEERQHIKLDDDFWEQEEKVTEEEGSSLEAEISKEEVKRAIDISYVEGALSLDGFSFMFYQFFWHVIKKDFMDMIKGFE